MKNTIKNQIKSLVDSILIDIGKCHWNLVNSGRKTHFLDVTKKKCNVIKELVDSIYKED